MRSSTTIQAIPISSSEDVAELVKDFRMKVNIEVATIKDACLEYNHS